MIHYKENQQEIYSKDSAKEEVCQVHSLPPFMSQLVNVVVKMMNSETSLGRIDEVFQVQDVSTGDQLMNLVVETTQDDFIESISISSSQEMINPDETNWGKWGEPSSLNGGSSKGMAAEIGSTRIGSGYGCARKEAVSSIPLGNKRAGICFENIRQQVEKCSRREFTETGLKKDVLSMFVEARNVFCQKNLDASYSREEMEVLRFENSYQQSQIWREMYSGLGPIVTKQLNQLAEARQNGNAITDQQHHQHQQHHRYPLQSLQHHQYSQQQQQHHQHPRKPPQHHHQQHQHQLAGLHREDTSFLGAGTAIGRPIHLRINMKNARTNCYVPHVH
ncbi:hypothetical protein MKW98_021254 [Papaver atlanticum]|uniref:Uncharacterized protein n=1 Tax=Papaver atlanticum TaxID=357466 RepID=A0AAD4X9Y3_9MAGN|nr:hypothetical protein MKW98_021254 [Papaver atlanticum]